MRSVNRLPVVVLTATRNRPQKLAHCFLPSVVGQTRAPDLVLLVDDSDAAHGAIARHVGQALAVKGIPLRYLRTAGGEGLAVAWNRGLHEAADLYADAWIAGLDDDDRWTTQHIAACLATATERDADVLFARSIPVLNGVPVQTEDKGEPSLQAFLRGNPGFRGSTMFARLRALLSVGGFDESMPSTLDRDLAVRLLTLPHLRWAVSEHVTVHYDVSDAYPRLSSRGSERKRVGLLRFYKKHRSRMSASDERAFWERAVRIFGVLGEGKP